MLHSCSSAADLASREPSEPMACGGVRWRAPAGSEMRHDGALGVNLEASKIAGTSTRISLLFDIALLGQRSARFHPKNMSVRVAAAPMIRFRCTPTEERQWKSGHGQS